MAAIPNEIKKALVTSRARARRRTQRDAFWADAEGIVYHPKETGGWSQTPRTIPMVATLIDRIGGKNEAGRLYLTLWSYDYGDGYIEIPDPALLGLEAGYSPTRAERTFGERMKVLQELGFIRTKPLGQRTHGYVLLLDPNVVIGVHLAEDPSKISGDWLSAYTARCLGVGLSPPVAGAKTWSINITGVVPLSGGVGVTDGTYSYGIRPSDLDFVVNLLRQGRLVHGTVVRRHPDTNAIVLPMIAGVREVTQPPLPSLVAPPSPVST